jgi:predicted metal-dependent phosphoesterase TrpH
MQCGLMTDRNIMEANPSKELCFDFHIHSKFSYDSLLSPKRIVRIAEKRGLDGIAITDHDTIRGALEASKFNNSIYVIIGSEIKTEIGDIIGLFLNEEITSKYFDEVVKEIKSQDGLVVLPHPYKKIKNVSNELLSKVDLIEVLNGRLSPELNYKAQILARNNDIPIIGGSDAHISTSIGSVKTIFNSEKHVIQDVEDIKQLLLKGNAKVVGRESPRSVHYVSATVGNVRKGDFLRLGKLFVKEFRTLLNKKV